MFTMTFKTENAAFADGDMAAEVARILKEVAAQIEFGAQMSGTVRDANGNRVGTYELEIAEDDDTTAEG